MDHKELCSNSSESTSVIDGSAKFVQNAGSLGKVEATAVRPCAIIGPDRVLPPNPDDTMYIKKIPGETWLPPENMYRRPPDYPNKISDYQPTRNISPRQTFQENMQRIMVPPTFTSLKNNIESSMKNTKPNLPQEAKYCDVPYNVNSVNNDQKSARNPDIPIPNVNPYTRNVPPSYGWPASVNFRPLRPYGAPEFYQYQEFSSCAGPRPMTMIRPHRSIHEESGPVYSERVYQDANIRFKPYPTGKDKHQQQRYDYVSNYPSTFHPPASFPPHKYDLQKSIHGHPYPAYPQVPFKYVDRRIHEPFVDGYHRSHNHQANFNSFNDQGVPPPYGPIPGNCMQSKSYPDISAKTMTINKLQFENNNNKVYLNLESRNKNYSIPENIYYNDMNQAMRGEILLPNHSSMNIHPISHHPIYRKDNNPLKSFDYSSNFRIFDQAINVNPSMQRLPLQFSPNTFAISPSDSNTSNDTAHTLGTSQDDYGYVSQSSTASLRSLDSGNVPIPQDIYRRQCYNNYDTLRNTFHTNGSIHKNKTSSSNKKNLNVRQFLQMWNEGDEEISESNKAIVSKTHVNNFPTQSESVNNQEQLYVLGLVTVPNEELDKYDHIQKISKLPENIKGYNGIEILNQYEELVETPCVTNYNKSLVTRNCKSASMSLTDRNMTPKLPRPVSPLDVEAKISQSVIHKEVGCNFEIKPCSPDMLNVEVATPVQSILGERTIKKVVNPLMTKSHNMARNDNTKSQNNVNDADKVASCEMISNQFSTNVSVNRLKPSNYSVQDLESNAGVCLASLPQLDNDIELNFPEINQQFIKANQMKSNVSTALQNISNIDIEQTYSPFPHEHITIQSPQPILNSTSDKESSKLSKYRKGKKSELYSSHSMTKNVILKAEESNVLQRVNSVIIKNPDTIKSQDTDSVEVANKSYNDNSSKCEQLYTPSKSECNDFVSETAIDFSLNKTESEISASYLNGIDKNVTEQLPPLEGLTESHMPSFDSCNDIQNIETKCSIPAKEYPSISEAEPLQSERFPVDIAKAHEVKKEHLNINKNELSEYESFITKTEASSIINSSDEDILELRKSPKSENISSIDHENTNIKNGKNLDTPWRRKNSLKSEYNLNVYKVEGETVTKNNNEICLMDTAKVGIDCLQALDLEKCNVNDIAKLNEVNSIEPCKMSYTIGSNANIENKSSTDSMLKQTVNEVFEVLSEQDFDNISDRKEIINDTVKSDNNLKSLKYSHCESDINPVIPIRETETNQKVSDISEIGISCIDNPKNLQIEDIYANILRTGTCIPKDTDSKLSENTEIYTETPCFESNTEKIASEIENETLFSVTNEKNIEHVELVQVGMKSPEMLPLKDCEENMEISEVDCLSDKSDISKKNDKNDPDASSSSKIQETKENCLCVVFKSDINNDRPKNERSFFSNEMSIEDSVDKIVESIQHIETNLRANDVPIYDETNVNKPEPQCLSDVSGIKTFQIGENTLFGIKNGIDPDNTKTEMEIDCNKSTSTIKCFQDINKRTSNIDFDADSNAILDPKSTELCLKMSEEQFYEKITLPGSKKRAHFRKELLSPWIQKLLLYTEGKCNFIKDINCEERSDTQIKGIPKLISNKDVILCSDYDVESCVEQTNNTNNEYLNIETYTNSLKYTSTTKKNTPVISERKEGETLNCDIVEITGANYELPPLCNKSNTPNFSVSAIEIKNVDSDFSSSSSCQAELKTEHTKDDSLKQCNNNNSYKIPTGILDMISDVKPRKITKRSLSESALEGYNENINFKLLQSCKRLKGNRSFAESPILTEDICNIIQTNRRNSISTFYNEDNVYILIENDLILTNENDDSEKICYEIADDCSGIESPNNMDDMNATDFFTDEVDQHCEYSSSSQNFEIDKAVEDSWVEDVACIETVFSEDVAENIIIDTQSSPKQNYPLNLENVDEDSNVFYDCDHIDKIKNIYGSTICNDNTQLIETLYRTPQMNVNKTLYNIEYQESESCLGFQNNDNDIASESKFDCSNIFESHEENEMTCYKRIDNKENMSENSTLNCNEFNQNFSRTNDINLKALWTDEQEEKISMSSCESKNDCITLDAQKENEIYSFSSSPEVSSTTTEDKNSSILLKITNCNGARVSQINEISSDTHTKISYKLTEKGEYQNYHSNFRSSRTLITKAAQKYIPPLKDTMYDLKVKLPLPRHRLQTLKNLKITKDEPKITGTTNDFSITTVMLDKPKKQKPKFEDVLKSIDEINFKKHKNKVKKRKSSIPKVLIKKNENGAHYTTSEVTNKNDHYNPDLTGRKWQPWVFIEKNKFIDGMVMQNKIKAVYCHRKRSFVLQEKFRKYKSVYNANFVITKPKSDISKKGNLKYTIRLKQI